MERKHYPPCMLPEKYRRRNLRWTIERRRCLFWFVTKIYYLTLIGSLQASAITFGLLPLCLCLLLFRSFFVAMRCLSFLHCWLFYLSFRLSSISVFVTAIFPVRVVSLSPFNRTQFCFSFTNICLFILIFVFFLSRSLSLLFNLERFRPLSL